MTRSQDRLIADLIAVENTMKCAPHIFTTVFARNLLRIQDAKLWRATPHTSFEDYCRERWGLEPAGVHLVLKHIYLK